MRSRGAFNLSEVAEYTKHLYAEDLEGYLQLAHIPNGAKGGFESIYITGTAVPKSLRGIEGEPDYFITPNSYYIPQRASRNIRHFRSLFIDLDLTAYGKTEAIYEVALLSGQGAIGAHDDYRFRAGPTSILANPSCAYAGCMDMARVAGLPMPAIEIFRR